MKIIDNKKDYYDYLVGQYGLDDYVVFDRRDNNVITKQLERFNKDISLVYDEDGMEEFKVSLWAGHNMKSKLLKVNVDKKTRTKTFEWKDWDEVVKIKSKDAWFRYSRFYRKDGKRLPEEMSPETPLILHIESLNYRHYDDREYTITNPILEGSIFTNILSAQEVYEGIYNYLLESKDPNIEDKRNDIEHLESHGFDKKTSFRKM